MLNKVTWTTSQRIHATTDGESTVCGHVFAGPEPTVHGELHVHKKKRHCRTCFVKKSDFKAPWLEPKAEPDMPYDRNFEGEEYFV